MLFNHRDDTAFSKASNVLKSPSAKSYLYMIRKLVLFSLQSLAAGSQLDSSVNIEWTTAQVSAAMDIERLLLGGCRPDNGLKEKLDVALHQLLCALLIPDAACCSETIDTAMAPSPLSTDGSLSLSRLTPLEAFLIVASIDGTTGGFKSFTSIANLCSAVSWVMRACAARQTVAKVRSKPNGLHDQNHEIA